MVIRSWTRGSVNHAVETRAILRHTDHCSLSDSCFLLFNYLRLFAIVWEIYWNNLKQTDLKKSPNLEVLSVPSYQTSNLSEIHLTKSWIIEFISIKLNEIAMICYNKDKCHCQPLSFFSKNRKILQYFAINWDFLRFFAIFCDFLQEFAKICNKLQKSSNIFEVYLFMVSSWNYLKLFELFWQILRSLTCKV